MLLLSIINYCVSSVLPHHAMSGCGSVMFEYWSQVVMCVVARVCHVYSPLLVEGGL